jgi:DNA-binding NarL/FixJ family response regulator
MGAALVGARGVTESWKVLLDDPFFASAVLESDPAIEGHEFIGFGASIIVSAAFADAEIANPRPDINSRIIASIDSGESVVATQRQVAQANAGQGVNVVILYGSCWRYEILNSAQSQEAQNLLARGFTEWHAGYRMRRILCETADAQARRYLENSIVYEVLASFPEQQRTLFCMSRRSVEVVAGSLGNVLFSYREPVLRLSASDQELLLAATNGATDAELASRLSVSLSAVKARWRSAIARIEESMPGLIHDVEDREGRGLQKRHRVLAYVRSHPEVLRPFDWSSKDGRTANGLA